MENYESSKIFESPHFSISKCVNPPSRSGWSTQVIYSQIFFFLFFCPTDDVTRLTLHIFFFVSTNLKIWSVKSILKNFEENPWHTYFSKPFFTCPRWTFPLFNSFCCCCGSWCFCCRQCCCNVDVIVVGMVVTELLFVY